MRNRKNGKMECWKSRSIEVFGGVGTFFQKGSDPPEARNEKAG